MNKRIELLAPAGDFEKLKTALYFGADAVYLGGKEFSLRAFADNFTEEELAAAVACAHGQGRKVYVTVNIFARNADFARLGRYFAFLQEIGADAALVTDAGALACARSAAPGHRGKAALCRPARRCADIRRTGHRGARKRRFRHEARRAL